MVPYLTNVALLCPQAEFLRDRAANTTSQFGEDGLIAACLEKFGVVNQWCFEVGAHDGLFFSNTHRLRCEGWNAVLIEADAGHYAKLVSQSSDKVRCVRRQIGPKCLDEIMGACGAPQDMDLGIIDIDGQDYWAWDGMRKCQPRLMLVEFDYGSEDEGVRVPILGAAEGQASYRAILQLGENKGYVPLARTTVNILFAKAALL